MLEYIKFYFYFENFIHFLSIIPCYNRESDGKKEIVKKMTQALEIKNLKKVYATGVEALRGIDLTVEEGDFYALLGPNGAGKSTTIGIITSLVNKTSGEVKVFGYDLDTDLVRAKQQIGLVPQEFNFNPFETVQQIVVNQAGYYGVSRQEAIKRSEK